MSCRSSPGRAAPGRFANGSWMVHLETSITCILPGCEAFPLVTPDAAVADVRIEANWRCCGSDPAWFRLLFGLRHAAARVRQRRSSLDGRRHAQAHRKFFLPSSNESTDAYN